MLVVASCSTMAVGFLTSITGKVWAPQVGDSSSESHWVWLRQPSALAATETSPRYEFWENPAEMRKAGIDYAIRQIRDLRENGVNNIHIYTMNKPLMAREIIDAVYH